MLSLSKSIQKMCFNSILSFFLRLEEQFESIKLNDLRVVSTLGVGGFGRVELVTLSNDSQRSFALKVMKKAQIVETRQQQHILSEKNIMLESNCPFIVKLFKTFKGLSNLYQQSFTYRFGVYP